MTREIALQTLAKAGFTAILIGYLMVWLPQPVVGLSFTGVEIGEWVKFLPEVRAGEFAPGRNVFYLPPVTLALMMILWSAGWAGRRWQTWVLRGLAVLVALLAFPALEAILFEPVDEWILRLGLVTLVIATAISLSATDRLVTEPLVRGSWIGIMLLASIGLLLPTWTYLALRPVVSDLFRGEVGIGAGVWLNAVGHLALLAASALVLFGRAQWKQGAIGPHTEAENAAK